MNINDINSNALQLAEKSSPGRTGKKDNGFSLSLHVNGQTEQVTVKIIENKSQETVKENSAQELHEIRDQIYDMAGRLFKLKV